MKHEAIFKLNPSVVTIRGDIAYDIDGNVMSYDEAAVTTEANMMEARAKRDRLLADSDWVTIRATDTGTAVPTEWQTYRQALRDITEQTGFPENIDWPQEPTA